MEDDIFSKIVRKEIPAEIVYEDELFLGFMDIMPAMKGHVLIIPKTKYKDATKIKEPHLSKYFQVIQTVANAVIKATGANGFKILNNCGESSGQTVFYIHFHIVPMNPDEELVLKDNNKWEIKSYEEGEMQKIATNIRQNLLS